ncbi:MAG: DNA-directed RNA polymerase subunit K [Nitrosopumilaceae archaeon]
MPENKEVKLSANENNQEVEEEPITKRIPLLSRMSKKDVKNLTDEEILKLEKMQKIIDAREVIEVDEHHEPIEFKMTGKGKMEVGPPTLTKFEKARIIGARALQLSQGAPPFISVPKNVTTSLDLAIEELEKRVIPITIRRVLPNGDFQNIPLDYFY